MQRRKVRRQGPESADERLDRALREISSQPTMDGVLEGDRRRDLCPRRGAGRTKNRGGNRIGYHEWVSSGGGYSRTDPLSQPPASPYSPHPFWSEKAKAEMELAHARPATLDEEAKRLGSGVARRPLDLETRAKGSTEVRVDEEVKEPTYDLRDGGAEGFPRKNKAIIDVNSDTDQGGALGPRESTMLTLPEVGLGRSLVRSPLDPQGAIAYPTEGNAEKILETAHEQVSAAAVQLSPKPAVQLSPKPGVQMSPQPAAPTSPRPGVQVSPDTRFRVEGSASEDQLLEITKLRSLVEHLSRGLKRRSLLVRPRVVE